MQIKALEKIIINGTIVDAGETYDGTAEELTAYISGGYVEVLEQDEKVGGNPADDQEEDTDHEAGIEPEEEAPEGKPKTTRRTVRRTKKTGE